MQRLTLGRPDDLTRPADGRETTTAHRAASPRMGWAWAVVLVLALVAPWPGAAAAASPTHRALTVSPLRHAIVFTRFLPGAGQGNVYRIDAGGTAAHLIRSGVLDFAALSPDGTRFTDFAAAPGRPGQRVHLQRL